ncbi:MAG: relaxase, partial [Ferruginibacter sp.]
HRKRLQTTIGWILNKKPASLEAFIKGLEKENISTVLRRGKEGVIYGITYVDHKAKVVFNGSDLGKMYSANAIVEQCKQTGQAPLTGYQLQLVKENDITFIPSQNKPAERQLKKEEGKSKQADIVSVGPIEFVPNQLLKKKKRKKKRLGI